MIETTAPKGTCTNPLNITDPLGEYIFEVEADVRGSHQASEVGHYLLATRTYFDTDDVNGIKPFDTELAWTVKHLIDMRITGSQSREMLEDYGVDITIVFKQEPAGRYFPVDILLNNVTINEFGLPAGLWMIDPRLAELIEKQSRGLAFKQVSYGGSTFHRATSAVTITE